MLKYKKYNPECVLIEKNCSCKTRGFRPANSCACLANICGDMKWLKSKYLDGRALNNILYISWYENKSISWVLEKITITDSYYGVGVKAIMQEYDIWLKSSEIQKMLQHCRPHQVTLIEISEIKENYLKDIYIQEFSHLSYNDYNSYYGYVNNPYIGYHLENLDVLACLELPWNIKILPA